MFLFRLLPFQSIEFEDLALQDSLLERSRSWLGEGREVRGAGARLVSTFLSATDSNPNASLAIVAKILHAASGIHVRDSSRCGTYQSTLLWFSR